jgi:hypothetical protein
MLAHLFLALSPSPTDAFLMCAASRHFARSISFQPAFICFQICRVACNYKRRAFELLASHDDRCISPLGDKTSRPHSSACGLRVVSRIEFVVQVSKLL